MGMFASIRLEDGVELPHFPDSLDTDRGWQSKQGLDVYDGPYRITSDGRLEKKYESYREKTDTEKLDEAERWGFDSWEAYLDAYDSMEENSGGLIPDEIDYDFETDDGAPPPAIRPKEQVKDDSWWGDCNYHGTFEFHDIVRENPVEMEERDGAPDKVTEWELDVYVEYEARFTKGELDEIVLIGDRGHDSDSREEIIEKFEQFEKNNE